jgi:cell division protein FtsL
MTDVDQLDIGAELDKAIAAAGDSATRARRAMLLALLVLACAAAVLAIDHGTKRQLLDEAKNVRAALDEAQKTVASVVAFNLQREAAGDGTTAAGEVGSGANPGVNGGDPVGPDARTRKAPTPDAKPRGRAPVGGPRGGRAGTRGNG